MLVLFKNLVDDDAFLHYKAYLENLLGTYDSSQK